MSDISLDSTVHVYEDTSATLSLRDIMAQAGFTTTAELEVTSFAAVLPNGELAEENTPLFGMLDGDTIYVRPGAWQQNYNGEFTTYQFVVEQDGGALVTLTVQVVIDPVNDAPNGADRDYGVIDRTPVVLGEDAFGFQDPVEGDHFKSVIITSLPVAGQVLLNGSAIATGTEVTIADVRAGALTFVASDKSGGVVEIGFHVRDDGGTVGPGAQDTSTAPNYLTFHVPQPDPTGGNTPPARVGDTVWEDSNANGIQDAGEHGIAGVTVELKDNTGAVVKTTTTGADGHYAFEIAAGTYTVQLRGTEGYIASAQGQGSDRTLDSDFGADGSTAPITLAQGEVNNAADAGLYRAATLTSRVWNDADRDGVRDAGEAPVANVKVTLLDGSGHQVASATTDGSGNYQFTNLKPGSYSVQFDAATLPAGYKFTTTGHDSAAAADGSTGQVTLVSGGDATLAAGIVDNIASIGDRVWEDRNANGVQDSGENGIAGATVQLKNAAGTVIATTTTDSSGAYGFKAAAGTYSVHVDAPSAYKITAADVGNDASDSDIGANGDTAQFTVAGGSTNTTIDAGLYRTASLGNRVWFDCDGDGIQDAGEVGIGGVKATLLDLNGKAIATTTTDCDGLYMFSGLKPGTYSVQFDKSALPSGYMITQRDAGNDDARDSDIGSDGISQKVTLVSGETNTTVDAGVMAMASIGDRVWLDCDGDGIQDNGEAGIGGITVKLTGSTGQLVATTKTDASGHYKFDVAAGTYSVSVDAAGAGYGITKQFATADTRYDSNADASGKLGTVTVAAGASNMTLDAGLVMASIGNRVWEDSNFNGVQDSGESGICGVTLKLYDASHNLKGTTVTAADGSYKFANLAAGSYSVELVKPNGWFATKTNVGSDAVDSDFSTSGSTTSTGLFKLAAGEQNMNEDAGLYRKASIGDKVWRDANHNGIQDSGEEGIGKIKVALYNASTGALVGNTVTDAKGGYLFSNLDPGSYYLKFDKTNVVFTDTGNHTYSMNDWKWGVKNVGHNDQIDSDVNGDGISKVGVTQTDATFLSSGENDMSWDATITPIAIDLNGDGIHTIARNAFQGSFDLLGTGKAIQSGWLSGNDAFLAVDANGNGSIDSIGELFGGAAKGSGFAKLASFDSNGDGVVNAADAHFSALVLWQDANSNGKTDAGELISLAHAGVTSLTVAFEELPFLDANNNLHLERSNAVINGVSHDMTDVYFNVSATDAAGVNAMNMAELIGQTVQVA